MIRPASISDIAATVSSRWHLRWTNHGMALTRAGRQQGRRQCSENMAGDYIWRQTTKADAVRWLRAACRDKRQEGETDLPLCLGNKSSGYALEAATHPPRPGASGKTSRRTQNKQKRPALGCVCACAAAGLNLGPETPKKYGYNHQRILIH
jgi:hypothetical protein